MIEIDSPRVWRKALRCDSANCVEVAFVNGLVAVRDSKQPDEAPFLTFTSEEWGAFVDGVRSGDFDLQ
jgi:Domain of unknown function (DUF397)